MNSAMFISASEAKRLVEHSNLNIELYKVRLAQLIEENAKQGNTVVYVPFYLTIYR